MIILRTGRQVYVFAYFGVSALNMEVYLQSNVLLISLITLLILSNTENDGSVVDIAKIGVSK